MNEMRTITYAMIFKVLHALSKGPQTFEQLNDTCMFAENDLRAVLSSAIYRRMVSQLRDEFYLTRKGARTAIYIMTLYEGMNYPKQEYRQIMKILDNALVTDDAPGGRELTRKPLRKFLRGNQPTDLR